MTGRALAAVAGSMALAAALAVGAAGSSTSPAPAARIQTPQASPPAPEPRLRTLPNPGRAPMPGVPFSSGSAPDTLARDWVPSRPVPYAERELVIDPRGALVALAGGRRASEFVLARIAEGVDPERVSTVERVTVYPDQGGSCAPVMWITVRDANPIVAVRAGCTPERGTVAVDPRDLRRIVGDGQGLEGVQVRYAVLDATQRTA
ncbi:hypothetical protein [Sinomonas halotolerans]|uniref:Uncharacterized protein n=1 Tax=Sinomonas halotolerans TaxID=1644133 RepID=A0ABU9WW07_9MICC